MIHSLSGGELKINNSYDFAKVENLNNGDIYWYISPFPFLKINDIVLVPLKENQIKGRVIRIDKNVSEQSFPIPIKKMRKIIKILS